MSVVCVVWKLDARIPLFVGPLGADHLLCVRSLYLNVVHIIRKNIIPPPFGPGAPVCAGLLFCFCGLLCVLVLVHIVHSTTIH